MKKYTVLVVFLMVCTSLAVHAQQQGFTGPMAFPQSVQTGFSGQGMQGFAGMVAPVSVQQLLQFPNKAPAILQGNIVSHLGGDRYLFRDSSGEVVIKIKHNRWWGLSVGPNDRVELGGELKRDKKTWMINYFDVKSIRV